MDSFWGQFLPKLSQIMNETNQEKLRNRRIDLTLEEEQDLFRETAAASKYKHAFFSMLTLNRRKKPDISSMGDEDEINVTAISHHRIKTAERVIRTNPLYGDNFRKLSESLSSGTGDSSGVSASNRIVLGTHRSPHAMRMERPVAILTDLDEDLERHAFERIRNIPEPGKCLVLKSSNGTDSVVPALNPTEGAIYTPIQVATAASFVAGIFYFIMSVARLGVLSSLLSEPLVSGFTTAAAVHVMVSQLKDLLGVSIPRYKGTFKVILSVRDIIDQAPNSNLTAVYTSLVVILFMIFMNEYFKPWLSTKCRFPVPAELMAVVGGTVASYLIGLGPNFDVGLVGLIPTGLPAPQFPPIALIKAVAVDSIAVTIVGYSIVMSMGMIFAQKDNYEVRPNQELVALGFTNIVGSMFSCIPTACSLSRSLIQHQTGGKTQIAAVFSSLIMLVVLLWIGPYFESLPRCVLAAIIVVALKGMLIQVYHIKKFHREGSLELFVWCVTFLSVVIIDIDIGLLIGVVISLISLYVKGWKTYYSLLGTVPDTAIYVDIGSHQRAEELPHIKIFKYTGSINFANKSNFKKALYKETKVHQRANVSLVPRYNGESTGLQSTKAVIIDLSSVPHIDTAACKMFTEVKTNLEQLSITLLLATPADCVYDALLHAESIGEGGFNIFPTIHDAVIYAQGNESAV
uniref:STAS domain-containing protein n=1 Tax=Anopheles culicifacies TaxID=139723 RepID=A0A182MFW5_9DIPT